MDDCITLALGLPEMRVIGQTHRASDLLIEVEYRTLSVACPTCGHTTTKVHDRRFQDKWDVPLHGQPGMVRVWRRRFRCSTCPLVRGRTPVFSEPNPVCGYGPGGRARRTTPRLRATLAAAIPHQTVQQVACQYQVGPRLVQQCFADHATTQIAAWAHRPSPRVLGMDEFAVRRGQRYATIICALDAPAVCEVLPGRGGPPLQHYLEHLVTPEQVQVVVMDMCETFRQTVQLCLPHAQIVVDRFHVLRHVSDAFGRVRRRVAAQVAPGQRDWVTRHRWRMLLPPTTWTWQEQAEIEPVLVTAPDLCRAWELTTAFQAWYTSANRDTAHAALTQWEQQVQTAGLTAFQALCRPAALFGRWRDEILNYLTYRYTNGYTEGKNTRTKQLMRQAYGYRNRDNLRLRIRLPVA